MAFDQTLAGDINTLKTKIDNEKTITSRLKIYDDLRILLEIQSRLST